MSHGFGRGFRFRMEPRVWWKISFADTRLIFLESALPVQSAAQFDHSKASRAPSSSLRVCSSPILAATAIPVRNVFSASCVCPIF